MAWLDKEDLDDWVETIDYDGNFLGWMRSRDAHHFGISTQLIEAPPLFKEHPYLIHHSIMLYEMGMLKSNDTAGLSEIQNVLLMSVIMRRNEIEEKRHLREFEESMMISNPQLYNIYREQRENEDTSVVDGMEIEERVPQNLEEFLAVLSAFEEEAEDAEDNLSEGGWLDAVLDEEELREMGE